MQIKVLFFRTIQAIVASAMLSDVVLAQANCAERNLVTAKLKDSYGEAFFGGGSQNAHRNVEVWASMDKGTWTILMTKQDGQTCIMASGTNWHFFENELYGTNELGLGGNSREVNLVSPDGSVNLTGRLIDFADGRYVIDTPLGKVAIASDRVDCFGDACP